MFCINLLCNEEYEEEEASDSYSMNRNGDYWLNEELRLLENAEKIISYDFSDAPDIIRHMQLNQWHSVLCILQNDLNILDNLFHIDEDKLMSVREFYFNVQYVYAYYGRCILCDVERLAGSVAV